MKPKDPHEIYEDFIATHCADFRADPRHSVVTSVGIGNGCLVVYLSRRMPKGTFPKAFKGVPIVAKVMGKLRPV